MIFDWFNKKVKDDESPPDEPNGKVEFCNPTIPKEVFDKEKSLDDFINKLNKNEGSQL